MNGTKVWGTVKIGNGYKGFVATVNGGSLSNLVLLGAIGGYFAEPRGVNTAGRATGYSPNLDLTEPNYTPFRTAANAPITPATDALSFELNPPVTDFTPCRAYGTGISSTGVVGGYVVGMDDDDATVERAARWAANATTPTLIGPANSNIFWVNEAGISVGQSADAAAQWSAVATSPSPIAITGVSSPSFATFADNTATNPFMTGAGTDGNGALRAWIQEGTSRYNLDNPPNVVPPATVTVPSGETIGYGVARVGSTTEVVGVLADGNGLKGFFWQKNPAQPDPPQQYNYVDFNQVIGTQAANFTVTEVRGINSQGTVVGFGTYVNNGVSETRAFIGVVTTP